ncbi:AMP-binding protein, partial [Nocardia sp. NPDC004722]
CATATRRPDGLVGAIEILAAGERERVSTVRSGSQPDSAVEAARIGTATMAKALAEVVGEDPQAPALVSDGQEIAYHVLDRRSSQLARLLMDRNVGPGDVVAVALPHTLDAVAAVWAILKAGAAVLFAHGMSIDEILAAGAKFGIAQEPPADPAHWLVPSDPSVQADLAARPIHPVSYSDRVRPLNESDPTFVYRDNQGTWTIMSQTDALDRASDLRTDHEIDYLSVTFTTAATGLTAIDEFLASATAGALSVLPTGETASDLKGGEVTHWFVTSTDPTEIADGNIHTIAAEGSHDRGPSQEVSEV